MEMSHHSGYEAESLLRPDQRNGAKLTAIKSLDGTEKTPFIQHEPVKLTPAWEGTNLPNDTLNLKGVAMELQPPKDRWHLIYFVLMFHGLGTLVPWNMFITASRYFMDYKLEGTGDYSEHFITYLGFASQIPNLIFSWLNVFIQLRGDLSKRIIWSLSIEILMFVVTIALAMIDTSNCKLLFFWLTIISVIILNVFNAIFQNSVYGVAAQLPARYTNAVVLGSNISGTVAVVIDWASAQWSDSVRTAAIYYFIGGLLIILACFDTYFALPLNRFYRYHTQLQTRNKLPALGASGAETSKRPPYGKLLRQTSVQLFNVFFVFLITLTVFPGVLIGTQKNDKNFPISDDSFTRVTCFLTFNLMAMIGNITASLVQWPSPRWLIVFTVLRAAFIPLFLMGNYLPELRTFPVYINNDWVYWLISVLLGWSSGHASSLGMMYVSRNVEPEYQGHAGMMGAASLVTGLVVGVALTRTMSMIVKAEVFRGLTL